MPGSLPTGESDSRGAAFSGAVTGVDRERSLSGEVSSWITG